MKKINISTALLLSGAMLLTSSCSDVLDTKPFTSFSEEKVWQAEETADAFVLNTYANVLTYYTSENVTAQWESRTPNGALCDQVGSAIDNYATELGLNSSENLGFNRFDKLRACNMIIEKVQASAGISSEAKKKISAEGHLLRGLLFFDQTRKMGRFVPITKVLTVNDKDDFRTPITETVGDSYKYVMADLDIACANLPETSAPGRANRYAALLIRSRAALQAYAYTKDAKYLDVAINSAKEVIESGKFTLSKDYGSMFNEKSPKDAEIILGRYYLAEKSSLWDFPEMVNTIPNIDADNVNISMGTPLKNQNGQTFEGWATMFPTQDMIDQYLAIDEQTGEAKPWYETSQYKENVEVIDPKTMTKEGQLDSYTRTNGEKRNFPTAADLNTGRTDYPLFKHYGKIKASSTKNITDIIYSNRDKRMDHTIVRDQATWQNELVEMNLGGNLSQGVRSKTDGGWYTTTTGYYWKKSTYTLFPRAVVNAKTDYHYVIARLGEAYMNLAEAYLLKKDVANAVQAFNVTRTIHGGLPASTSTTEADAWKDYIRERRVEMAYEGGDIYYSYLRWGKYGGYANYGRTAGAVIEDLNSPVYKIEISRNRKSFCVGQLTLLNSWNRNFTTKRYLFPIPQSEIDTRTAYGIIDKQNEGW